MYEYEQQPHEFSFNIRRVGEMINAEEVRHSLNRHYED